MWTSVDQVAPGLDIFGQVYDASGARFDVEFRVNTTAPNYQGQPAVAPLAGGFLAAWASKNQDGSLEGIFGQRFLIQQ